MISATPDVLTVGREAGDEFILLACDGIWDVVGSQEAVDFINERLPRFLKAGKPLSGIMEELLDHCLSPDLHSTQGLVIIVISTSTSSSSGSGSSSSSSSSSSIIIIIIIIIIVIIIIIIIISSTIIIVLLSVVLVLSLLVGLGGDNMTALLVVFVGGPSGPGPAAARCRYSMI